MDYTSVFKYFLNSDDFEVQPSSYFNQDVLSVCVEIEGHLVTLIHFCIDELQQLPSFFLKNYASFGVLAHVHPSQNFEGLGSICVNHLDSVSINFERPELVFEESIKRHVKLLRKLITNSEFNQSELLREFRANWYINTKNLMSKSPKMLYCTSHLTEYAQVNIYAPLLADDIMSISASFTALPDKSYDQYVARFFQIDKRQQRKGAIGFILSLQSIDPVVPNSATGLKVWLLKTLQKLSPDKELFSIKAKEFWLVLNVITPSGKTWVGMKLYSDKKRTFSLFLENMEPWKIEPVYVDVFNKELMLPRSGANPSLDNKRVLLFGCGSVGSEVAHKLGAAGIGHIDIVDMDQFTTSNLYRHTLDIYKLGWPKAIAVALQLQTKFPWLKVNGYQDYLLNNRDTDVLRIYDLVIIAIGAPTQERLFHDYIIKSGAKVPVIYSWLEGYGIGGHAVLDVPHKKGCLRCAYVESNTGIRGLASNLNFLEPDQNIVKSYAGCGEMFIPYGAISSTQTALIAADLAVSYLEGKLTESTKISWKGDSADAEREGLKLTSRYHIFESSLKKQPLLHPLCDICHPEAPIVYQSKSGKRLCLPPALHETLCSYRQTESTAIESAGLLIGCYKHNGDVLIDNITIPKTSDERTRTTFKLDAKAHQEEIEAVYTSSEQFVMV